MDQNTQNGGGRIVADRVSELEDRVALVEATLLRLAEVAERLFRLDELTRQLAYSDRGAQ